MITACRGGRNAVHACRQTMYLWIKLACVPAAVGMLQGPLIPILSQGRAARAPPWTASLMPEPGM